MNKGTVARMLVVLILVAAGLAGCGSNNDGRKNSDAGEKITIKFMHLWSDAVSATQNKVVNAIIEAYIDEHPNVKIDQVIYENEQYKNQMKVLSAGNDLPDIGMTWAAGYLEPFVKGNLFADLNDTLSVDLKGLFVPGTTDSFSLDGVTYALPIELNIVPIFYNKEIFANYGLEPPETYEDFENIIKVLVENQVAPIALGNKDKWTGSMWYIYMADRIGGEEPLQKVLDRTGSFEVPSFIDAARKIQDLVDMNAFIEGFNGLTNDEGKLEFMNEKAAMYLMGTWELPHYTTNPDVPEAFKKKIGFMKFPGIGSGDGGAGNWVGGPGVGLFVSENSTVKEQAKDFLKFFIKKWGELSVTDAGVIPATKVDTSKVDLHPLYIEMLNELSSASHLIPFYDVTLKPNSADVHKNLIQALFGKAITPEEFATQQEQAMVEEYGG